MIKFKLDFGASEHLVRSNIYLTELRILTNPVVIHVAKEGQSLLAYRAGVVGGMSNQEVALQAQDMKVVEGLRENLKSVSKLTNAGVEVSFGKQEAALKKDEKFIATAYLQGDLYELEIKIFPVIARASINLRRQEIMVIPIFFNQNGEKLDLAGPKDGARDVHVQDVDEPYPRDYVPRKKLLRRPLWKKGLE